MECLKFELLSQSPRALLILDVPVSLASFLPHILGCSNTALLLHVQSVISLCIALAIPFDLNFLRFLYPLPSPHLIRMTLSPS